MHRDELVNIGSGRWRSSVTLRNKGGFAKTVDVIRGRGEGVKNDYWLMSDLVEAFQ